MVEVFRQYSERNVFKTIQNYYKDIKL